jgi:hypothetical protein
MAAPEDRPEISKLKDDITIPTALIQMVVAPSYYKRIVTDVQTDIIRVTYAGTCTDYLAKHHITGSLSFHWGMNRTSAKSSKMPWVQTLVSSSS